MPWSVAQDERCPADKPWGVVKDSDDSLEGCHATEDEAKAQQAALYANEASGEPKGENRADRPPRDNLVRAIFPGPELREQGAGMPTLHGYLAVFDQWAKIDSAFEGTFMERVAAGAFSKTFKEGRDRFRILFQHGSDPQIGDKPLAPAEELDEDEHGAFYAGQLLDTTYNRDLVPGLRAGVYGSSFRFRVTKEDLDMKPKRSSYNPDALPERTIREVEAFEAGPVTFPAYIGTSAGVRSLTDDYLRSRLGPAGPSALPHDGAGETHSDAGSRGQSIPPVAPKKETPTVEYITREEKASRVAELKTGITKRATEYPGVFPEAVQAEDDAENHELDALERDIAAWDARMERIRAFAGDDRKVDPAPRPINVIKRPSDEDIYDVARLVGGSRSMEERNQKLRDNAMRATEQLRVAGDRYDQDKSRQRLANLLDFTDSEDKEIALRVLTTNSPQYRAAFNRYIKSGGEERGAALAVGVDGTGGYAVPVSFDPTVIAIGAWTAVNPFRASCRVVTISGTDTWQALTATAITAAYAAEADAASEQGPTFARPEFIAKRAHAFVTASYEMAQDRPDLAAELGTLFGEAKDTLEENKFTLGAGTTPSPEGIGLKDAITRVDSVTNDTVAVADIRALEAALPIRHRFGAAWYLTRAAIRAIQAFETTGGQLFSGQGYPAVGNPVTNLTGNTGLTLLGYPIYETPSMPWTPTVDDTTWGVLMNPKSCYVIVDRIGMSVRVIPDMLDGSTPSTPTGEIGIYAFWRNTARVLNVDAGRQGAVQ